MMRRSRYKQKVYSEVQGAGAGFGLGFSVVLDPAAYSTVSSVGTYAWGGAAATVFWLDPTEELVVIFMTQVRRSLDHGKSWGNVNRLYLAAHQKMTLIITLPLLLQVMGYVLEPLRGQLERLVYGAFADEQPSEWRARL